MSWLELAEKSTVPTVVSALEAFRENPAAIHMLKMVTKVALSIDSNFLNSFVNTDSLWNTIIPELVGLTLKDIEINAQKDEILLHTIDGQTFKFYHDQDCCEDVSIEDIIGDLNDLIGSPLVRAEERTECGSDDQNCGSTTFTFYEFCTIKGSVTIRWVGSSNGYYSESVEFCRV